MKEINVQNKEVDNDEFDRTIADCTETIRIMVNVIRIAPTPISTAQWNPRII
jgi:hypothetical protein